MFGSGTTTLIILNKEMNDIMKIIKSLEESGLLTKEQKGGFFRMFLGILDATLLTNLLTVKGAITMSKGRGTVRAGKGTSGAGQDF